MSCCFVTRLYEHLYYITTNENPADEVSRRLSSTNCQLIDDVWQSILKEFGGRGGSYFWPNGAGFKCNER